MDMSDIKKSAGIAIIYDNKILLVHPTNGTWKKGICGIPKGHIEKGEDPLDTAIRETYEEVGILIRPNQLESDSHTLDIYSDSGKLQKQIIYFVCRVSDLSEIGLSSETVSKKMLQLDEVDWAKFVDPMTAYSIISRGQMILIDRHLSI
jgi:8-oxo-dGTP pyrophosphatase MutT (NUDIX family)